MDVPVGRTLLGRTHPSLLTQSVGDARLHIVSADVTDPVLMLRLGQHHNANVPEGVDGNLVGRTTLSPSARARESHLALTSWVWGSLSVIP